MFKQNSTPLNQTVLSMVPDFGRFAILNDKLRQTKVYAAGKYVLLI